MLQIFRLSRPLNSLLLRNFKIDRTLQIKNLQNTNSIKQTNFLLQQFIGQYKENNHYSQMQTIKLLSRSIRIGRIYESTLMMQVLQILKKKIKTLQQTQMLGLLPFFRLVVNSKVSLPYQPKQEVLNCFFGKIDQIIASSTLSSRDLTFMFSELIHCNRDIKPLVAKLKKEIGKQIVYTTAPNHLLYLVKSICQGLQNNFIVDLVHILELILDSIQQSNFLDKLRPIECAEIIRSISICDQALRLKHYDSVERTILKMNSALDIMGISQISCILQWYNHGFQYNRKLLDSVRKKLFELIKEIKIEQVPPYNYINAVYNLLQGRILLSDEQFGIITDLIILVHKNRPKTFLNSQMDQRHNFIINKLPKSQIHKLCQSLGAIQKINLMQLKVIFQFGDQGMFKSNIKKFILNLNDKFPNRQLHLLATQATDVPQAREYYLQFKDKFQKEYEQQGYIYKMCINVTVCDKLVIKYGAQLINRLTKFTFYPNNIKIFLGLTTQNSHANVQRILSQEIAKHKNKNHINSNIFKLQNLNYWALKVVLKILQQLKITKENLVLLKQPLISQLVSHSDHQAQLFEILKKIITSAQVQINQYKVYQGISHLLQLLAVAGMDSSKYRQILSLIAFPPLKNIPSSKMSAKLMEQLLSNDAIKPNILSLFQISSVHFPINLSQYVDYRLYQKAPSFSKVHEKYLFTVLALPASVIGPAKQRIVSILQQNTIKQSYLVSAVNCIHNSNLKDHQLSQRLQTLIVKRSELLTDNQLLTICQRLCSKGHVSPTFWRNIIGNLTCRFKSMNSLKRARTLKLFAQLYFYPEQMLANAKQIMQTPLDQELFVALVRLMTQTDRQIQPQMLQEMKKKKADFYLAVALLKENHAQECIQMLERCALQNNIKEVKVEHKLMLKVFDISRIIHFHTAVSNLQLEQDFRLSNFNQEFRLEEGAKILEGNQVYVKARRADGQLVITTRRMRDLLERKEFRLGGLQTIASRWLKNQKFSLRASRQDSKQESI